MDLRTSTVSSKLSIQRPLVLAVDDNEDNLLMLVQALECFEFASISTLEGEAVVGLAEQHQPDLILLDMILSDMDGITVLQQLKRHPATRHIPVIAVTALAGAAERQQMLEMGCSGCLAKPYDIDELQLMLEDYLTQIPSAS
jgi:two-component system, cell cycle response regulator DivK